MWECCMSIKDSIFCKDKRMWKRTLDKIRSGSIESCSRCKRTVKAIDNNDKEKARKNINKTLETIAGFKKRKVIVCKGCGFTEKHFSKGMCRLCYDKQRRG